MTTEAVPPGLVTPLLGLATACTWGGADFAGGLASRRAPAIPLVALAHLVSFLALLVAALMLGGRPPAGEPMLLGAFAGVVNILALMCFYQALGSGPMGLNAAVCGLLTAVVPVGFAFATEGWARPIKLGGFVLAGAAIALIAWQPREQKGHKGLGLSVLAGIGFGIFLIAMKFAGEGGVWWPLTCSRFAGTVIGGGVVLVSSALRRAPPRAGVEITFPVARNFGRRVLLLASLAGFLDATGNLLYVLATRSGRLDVAAVLSSLYPASTILLAVWILDERATRWQATGMMLALGAVALISF